MASSARQKAEHRLRQERFLIAFSQVGTVLHAAKIAEIDRKQHSRWLKDDPEYAARFAQAEIEAIEHLEREARRRAMEGTDEPIYWRGEKIDTVKKYSDVLLIFLLKAARPERYRERVDLTHTVGDLSRLTAEELQSMRQLVAKARGEVLAEVAA